MFDWDAIRKERLEFDYSIVLVCSGDHPDIIKMIYRETLPGLIQHGVLSNFEVIISDGTKNPSDDYIDLLTKAIPYYIKDSLRYDVPVRVVMAGDNCGCSGNWNNGLKLARGKYVFGCASDYIVNTPDFLKILSEPMEKDPKLACTSHRVARNNSECLGQPFPDVTGTYVTYAALDGLMLRNSALKEIDYIDEDIWPYMGEDAALGLRLQRAGYKVMKVELPLDVHLGQRSVHTRKDPKDDNSSMWPRESVQSMWDRNKEIMKRKYADVLNREKTWNE